MTYDRHSGLGSIQLLRRRHEEARLKMRAHDTELRVPHFALVGFKLPDASTRGSTSKGLSKDSGLGSGVPSLGCRCGSGSTNPKPERTVCIIPSCVVFYYPILSYIILYCIRTGSIRFDSITSCYIMLYYIMGILPCRMRHGILESLDPRVASACLASPAGTVSQPGLAVGVDLQPVVLG